MEVGRWKVQLICEEKPKLRVEDNVMAEALKGTSLLKAVSKAKASDSHSEIEILDIFTS